MIIVKIGGGESINLNGIISDLAEIPDSFIIVHGANALRDQLAKELKKPKQIITSATGYSSVFSDESALDIMLMAYAGLKNKRIVELCHQKGINAVGLSGLDGKIVQGKRNTGIRVKENGKLKIIRDFSGKPQKINQRLLNLYKRLKLRNHVAQLIHCPILIYQNLKHGHKPDCLFRL